MDCEELLIGFDTRTMQPGAAALWDRARRDLYLLRRDVERPLSVDPLVWPPAVSVAREMTGPSTRYFTELWDDLSRLRLYLQAHESDVHTPYWTIGITLLRPRFDWIFPQEDDVVLPRTSPPAIESAWTLLGYDIADGALLSGLMNCGYRRENVRALQERWQPHLNAFHLFRDQAEALAFRTDTDQRVPEHAPFYVFGLYSISKSPPD